MPESKTNAAESRTVADKPAAGAGSHARTGPRRTTDGITITRWSLGLSLTLALTVLIGAFTLVWDRTASLEAQMRDLRLEVRADIGDLRGDLRGLRAEVRADIDDLRAEVSADIDGLRDEVRELAALIRARETPDRGAQECPCPA